MTWTYEVTNTGNVTLDVTVTDDQSVVVSCPATVLAPAGKPGSSMTCSATGIAAPGQYRNVGIADGVPLVGLPVQDTDQSH